MLYITLLVLAVGLLQAQYLDPGVQINVANAPYLANLQPCFLWNSLSTGPLLSDVATYCPGEVYYSCVSAVSSSIYSIVAHGPFTDTLGLAATNTVTSPNGAPFFRTPTSIGIGSDTSLTNCSLGNSTSTLCWNVNSTTSQIGVGGWCGPEGFQSQLSVFFGIFSLPCLNSTIGSACTVPGVGLCNTGATCNANYTCSGGTDTVAPVPTPSSCWTAPFCNPMTGVYDLVNTTAGISCSTGDSCLMFETCNGLQSCIGGISPCIASNNTCLDSPVCTSINSTYYTCDYPVAINNTCIYDDGYLCRENDFCALNGTCVPGAPLAPPILDFCQTNATCNISTGTFYFSILPDYTNCTVPQNLCWNGICLEGLCSNLTNTTSPFTNLSVCLAPVCNTSTGNWSTVSAEVPGQSCDIGDPCTIGYCLVNGSCASFGPLTCPHYPSVPCINSTCVPNVGCVNMTLNGTSCIIDQCNIDGYCGSGVCLGTTVRNCTGVQINNPFCAYAACNVGYGCYTAYYNQSVQCPNACYVGNVGFCEYGACFGNSNGLCTSGVSNWASPFWWSFAGLL